MINTNEKALRTTILKVEKFSHTSCRPHPQRLGFGGRRNPPPRWRPAWVEHSHLGYDGHWPCAPSEIPKKTMTHLALSVGGSGTRN